jgi:hypothetical protein
MKKTRRRRKPVTSSLNEISTDQLGKYSRVVVGVEALLRPPPLLSTTGVNDTGDKFIAGIKSTTPAITKIRYKD